MQIPVLETERLTMRGLEERDFEAEAAFYASERSCFVGGPMDREQSWRLLASLIGHWQLRGYGFWALEEKSTGHYVGRVGMWYPEGWPEPEIGWTLTEAGEGKGYAFESALKARDYAYKALDWPTAISLIDAGNIRSEALAAKLGCWYEYDYQHVRYGAMRVFRHPAPEELQ